MRLRPVTANIVLSRWGANSTASDPLNGFEEPFQSKEREGNGRKGGELNQKKGRKKRDITPLRRNRF